MDKIPNGFCQCGCGQRTSIVKYNDPKHGYKKGDYRRYINGHHIENMRPGYKSDIHPKICVICGKIFLPRKPSRQETQVACSARCRNTYNSHVSQEQRWQKLRDAGEGKAYRKTKGKHTHRVVMERILGRPLLPGEIVHHKDGNYLNNHPDNLELLNNQSEHASIHMKERWEKKKCSSQ